MMPATNRMGEPVSTIRITANDQGSARARDLGIGQHTGCGCVPQLGRRLFHPVPSKWVASEATSARSGRHILQDNVCQREACRLLEIGTEQDRPPIGCRQHRRQSTNPLSKCAIRTVPLSLAITVSLVCPNAGMKGANVCRYHAETCDAR